MDRAILAAISAALLFQCASVAPKPSVKRPVNGCVVSCPFGFSFQRQHLCRGGTRQFTDVKVTERRTTRESDGTIKTDIYITNLGDFGVIDVILTVCEDVIRSIVLGRSIEQRGLHPGERDYTKEQE